MNEYDYGPPPCASPWEYHRSEILSKLLSWLEGIKEIRAAGMNVDFKITTSVESMNIFSITKDSSMKAIQLHYFFCFQPTVICEFANKSKGLP